MQPSQYRYRKGCVIICGYLWGANIRLSSKKKKTNEQPCNVLDIKKKKDQFYKEKKTKKANIIDLLKGET